MTTPINCGGVMDGQCNGRNADDREIFRKLPLGKPTILGNR